MRKVGTVPFSDGATGLWLSYVNQHTKAASTLRQM